MNSNFYNFYYSVFDVDFIISIILSSGSWTRTNDLMVMSHTSYLLLYPTIFLDKDMKTFLIYQIFFNFFVVCTGFEPVFLLVYFQRECPVYYAKHPLDEQTILFFFDKDMKTFLIYQIFFNYFNFCGYGADQLFSQQPVYTYKLHSNS